MNASQKNEKQKQKQNGEENGFWFTSSMHTYKMMKEVTKLQRIPKTRDRRKCF